jgi:hypothetical protein
MNSVIMSVTYGITRCFQVTHLTVKTTGRFVKEEKKLGLSRQLHSDSK